MTTPPENRPYPLLLERHLSPRPWGGTRLREYLDLEIPPDATEPIGESWEAYARNRILNGPQAGRSLQDAANDTPDALLGTASTARYGSTVPLLAKFIDAAEPLSIQVHPDDAYALEHESDSGHLGKNEAWYVLEAAPDAWIYWGFTSVLDRDGVRAAVAANDLERHLNRVPVAPGDVIYNPAGTLHAIGGGILLYEIQQSSDLTYRLYDYGRTDATGRPRELHVERALDVLDLEPGERAKVAPRRANDGSTILVATPHFVLERREIDGVARRSTSPTTLEILTVLEGELELESEHDALTLRRGSTVVLPATLGAYAVAGRGTLLRSFVPDA